MTKMPQKYIPESDHDPRVERVRRETEEKLRKVGTGWAGFEKTRRLYRFCFDGRKPWVRRALAFGALIYLIVSTDLWPDWFPGGLLDDLAVIVFVAAQVLPDGSVPDASDGPA